MQLRSHLGYVKGTLNCGESQLETGKSFAYTLSQCEMRAAHIYIQWGL
jgi:hypothetical protein